ncbi:MAG: hypothetical protein NVSMB39_7490 [Candidatus Saccharimonadales bacterium]
MPSNDENGDELIKPGVDIIKYVAEKPDVKDVGGATRVWKIDKDNSVKQLSGSMKLTDAQLAEPLKVGGRESAKPDFDKLVKKAAKLKNP